MQSILFFLLFLLTSSFCAARESTERKLWRSYTYASESSDDVDMKKILEENAKWKEEVKKLQSKIDEMKEKERKHSGEYRRRKKRSKGERDALKLLKKEKYFAWKQEAEVAVMEIQGASIKLNDAVYPSVSWYNEDSKKNDCSREEKQLVNSKLSKLMDGLLESRGFHEVAWETMIESDEDTRRRLRGATDIQEQTDRDLFSVECGICEGRMKSRLCSSFCAYRVRRRTEEVQGDDNLLAKTIPYEQTIGTAEFLAGNTKLLLEDQCRRFLELLSTTAAGLQHSCRLGLVRALCVVDNVEPEEIVGVEGPDGFFQTAADYVEQADERDEFQEEAEDEDDELEEEVEDEELADEEGGDN